MWRCKRRRVAGSEGAEDAAERGLVGQGARPQPPTGLLELDVPAEFLVPMTSGEAMDMQRLRAEVLSHLAASAVKLARHGGHRSPEVHQDVVRHLAYVRDAVEVSLPPAWRDWSLFCQRAQAARDEQPR